MILISAFKESYIVLTLTLNLSIIKPQICFCFPGRPLQSQQQQLDAAMWQHHVPQHLRHGRRLPAETGKLKTIRIP